MTSGQADHRPLDEWLEVRILGGRGRRFGTCQELIGEAIPPHIQSLREHGEPVPDPTATGSTKVRVAWMVTNPYFQRRRMPATCWAYPVIDTSDMTIWYTTTKKKKPQRF